MTAAAYYQDEQVTLHLGDWRELIPADFTADLILTDPPYGETSLTWDRWPTGWPSLAARHARSMWCFGSMRMFLEQRDEFAGWRLSQDVVWRKNRGSIFATDRFSRVHEHALHWYTGEWATIHHQTPRVASQHGDKGKVVRNGQAPHTGTIGTGYPYVDDGLRLQPSVIEARNMHRKGTLNATQKPVPLLEPLIAYGCPLAGTVLDLFAGSGSTLIAARNLGRKGVGYEVREEQAEKTALRLSQGVLDFGGATA